MYRKALVLRLDTARKLAVFALASPLMCVLAFSGCASYSRQSYTDTVSTLRTMCQSHDVNTQGSMEMERPVFGLSEEGGTDQDRWMVEFSEGHPEQKADLAFPKRTQISVVRLASGQVDYSVRCYDAGLKIDARNKDREDYWDARIESALVGDASSR